MAEQPGGAEAEINKAALGLSKVKKIARCVQDPG